jgi:hypothetical protein
MEAASTSETSVNFYQTTRRNILEDSHLHVYRPIHPPIQTQIFYQCRWLWHTLQTPIYHCSGNSENSSSGCLLPHLHPKPFPNEMYRPLTFTRCIEYTAPLTSDCIARRRQTAQTTISCCYKTILSDFKIQPIKLIHAVMIVLYPEGNLFESWQTHHYPHWGLHQSL